MKYSKYFMNANVFSETKKAISELLLLINVKERNNSLNTIKK